MKHIKLFKTENNYNNWLNSDKFVTPYISKNKYNNSIVYQKRLPKYYDSEILYLESTGNQYINLDYDVCAVWNIGLSGEIVMQRLNDDTGERAYIGRSSVSGFDLYTYGNGQICLWVQGLNCTVDLASTDTLSVNKDIHNVIFNMKNNGDIYLKIDNDEYSQTLSSVMTNYNKYNIQLFCHNNKYYSIGRIYSCKLWFEGVMVYDLIPVRKNGIGYMYDKLTHNLYGESSGSNTPFILGPDI